MTALSLDVQKLVGIEQHLTKIRQRPGGGLIGRHCIAEITCPEDSSVHGPICRKKCWRFADLQHHYRAGPR